MKGINILGNSQREQWHSIVNMLRQLGGSLDLEGRSMLCDELDRYIDFCEDALSADDSKEEQGAETATPEAGKDNPETDDDIKVSRLDFGSELFKPDAFYTGGGIYLCAMWIDDFHYYVVESNPGKDPIEEKCLTLYDSREDDGFCEFETIGMVWSKEASVLNDEERKHYNALLREIHAYMKSC